jgi:orotate phosphoribosyltransferase-like protein
MKLRTLSYAAWKYDKEQVELKLKRVREGLSKLKQDGVDYDFIAVCGTSGSWLAAHLVMDGYNVVMVRKQGEENHSHGTVEGVNPAAVYRGVFLDDLIVSGDTLEHVVTEIRKECRNTKIVHVLLYDGKCDAEWYYREKHGVPVLSYY